MKINNLKDMPFFVNILCYFLIVVSTHSAKVNVMFKSVGPGARDFSGTECHCESPGVNKTLDPCQNFTGQCPCLPNVTGKLCDECEKNHFGIIRGFGCQSCNCNPNGSKSASCNETSGQCDCKDGFGGHGCDECQKEFWGDPQEQCSLCTCNLLGTNETVGQVCDRTTGQCPCLPHVINQSCDKCEKNHYGFSSGTGCKPCDCDLVGSYSNECVELSGQCICKDGFFGHHCDGVPTRPPPIITDKTLEEQIDDEDYTEGSGFSTTDDISTLRPNITNISTDDYKPAITYRTFKGNAYLLSRIDEIAAEVAPNTHDEDKNLTYTSYVANFQKNSSNITLQPEKIDGPEITVLKYAVFGLSDSSIKMIVFEEKNKSQLIGDIVVIKTNTSAEHSYSVAVLQIKFGKRKIFYPDNTNWTCVFWDSSIFKWSDYGMETKFEAESIVCSSFHLSTFSILLPDPNQILFNKRYERESQHMVWLTTISRIGSWITVCFLILLIIINYRKKTGNETRKILMNSSVALLLTHFTYQIHTFFAGYSQCLIVNFMKYYCVLAFLLWTAADGINMWRILLADVFNTKGHIFYRWYKIISWGLPMITTSIGVFFFTSQGNCKLQFNKTYDLIFYLVPCLVILCCNMLLFTWMFLNMTNKDILGRLKDKKIDYILALSQVFGIGWCVVFPFLYFESTQLLAEYLLVGVISTQGLLIFVVRSDVVKNLRSKLQNRSYGVSTWFETNVLKSCTGHASRTPGKNTLVELDTLTHDYSETN